ncbi:MAG: sigma factor [Candidatus Limnocylindrales bacterium]
MSEALVRRIQDGDREALEALIVEHHRRLFVLAHGILRDPHAAEDATQQAFIDIWHDIGSLRGPDGTVWIVGGSAERRRADRIHIVPPQASPAVE